MSNKTKNLAQLPKSELLKKLYEKYGEAAVLKEIREIKRENKLNVETDRESKFTGPEAEALATMEGMSTRKSTREAEKKMSVGGNSTKGKKKNKDSLSIIIGIGRTPKMKIKEGKTKMAYGGMSGGKKHMYVAGGSVKDNPGLMALKGSGPKGMEAYKKITGKDG